MVDRRNLRPEAHQRIRELINDPIAALNAFSAPPGWQMHRHKTLVERTRIEFAVPSEAADDDSFLRDLHSILRAWYGKRARLIIDFDDGFKCEIRKAARSLDGLSDLNITNDNHRADSVADQLWDVIGNLRLTTGEARIVSGTKAIHHLIPDLIPPMDNKYTGEFFLGRQMGQGGRSVFCRIYQAFSILSILLARDEDFVERVGTDFNTSITKTVDNAIIGYMQIRGK